MPPPLALLAAALCAALAAGLNLTCVPSPTVQCCSPGTKNCDPSGFLYVPISCRNVSACACVAGRPVCGLCPDDQKNTLLGKGGDSDFAAIKVCYCAGVPQSDSGSQFECHPAKPYGPRQLQRSPIPSDDGGGGGGADGGRDAAAGGGGGDAADKTAGDALAGGEASSTSSTTQASSPSPPPSSSSSSSSSSFPLGIAVGGGLGAVGVLVAAVTAIYCLCCCGKKKGSSNPSSPPSPSSSSSSSPTSFAVRKRRDSAYVPFADADGAAPVSWRDAGEDADAAGMYAYPPPPRPPPSVAVSANGSAASAYGTAHGDFVFPPLPEGPPPPPEDDEMYDGSVTPPPPPLPPPPPQVDYLQ